ncbi:MAG: MFS transporter [Hyphomicrobiales bacterium]|nr:MAG: MFS transporter [Hyphomicrobiales bacterium]
MRKLPIFYGWVIVGVVFISMALGVNARTAFSLLFPPMLSEFGWERGLTAGAFSFGFLISALLSPVLGRWMDRFGPILVMELGVVMLAAGLLLAPYTSQPWHLYLTLGVLVGGGSVCLGYSGQSLFLPNWFVRKRGMAMSLAFAGVGIGSVIILPWVQSTIDVAGWRTACVAMGIAIIVILAPLNLLLRKRPEDMGLEPDGDRAPDPADGPAPTNVVDKEWAAVDWTLRRALSTTRFWWLATGYFSTLFVWYAVQVHQTKYLVEIGYDATLAAWALGFVSLAGIPGQIFMGTLSDRIGREWIFTISNLGFACTYGVLIAMQYWPSMPLLFAMVACQGVLGYGITPVFGPVVAEIFQGKHYGTIFGTLMFLAITGGAAGPWIAGLLHDWYRTYDYVFALCIGLSLLSAATIWFAAPGKVRAVAGKMKPTTRP